MMEVMSASFVYLLLRQVLQMLTQLAETAGPRMWRSWCYATR
jgi:hypothetical protein